ncbi:DUF4390 domain-containing protein [Methylovorus sp. MM2]|uniref:DUF4390 domain-containing protein n=1 Tax=Methylovorus sp. MM2 TaxID=1848038 RepID=UPI00352E5C32
MAVYAAASSLHIKTAELVATNESYALHADFDLNLSAEVEDALSKGIPLTFLIEFQLLSPRKYWFDDEIISASSQVTLSYHALSRQYLVNRNNHQQTFVSLQEAKEELSHLRDWQVLDKTLLKKGEIYHAGLRIRLDQSKLPKPLQVEALGSANWDMISERYHWTPAFVL